MGFLSLKETEGRSSAPTTALKMTFSRMARVDYCDPYLPEALPTRKHDLGMKSVPCTAEAFAEFDAVLVSTAHDQFKDPGLWAGVKLVVDTRNSWTESTGAFPVTTPN